jgi:hypothetical protein
MDLFLLVGDGRWQRLRLVAKNFVAQGTFDGFAAVREHTFHQLIEEQTRAVDVLVHHPRGKVRR